MNPHVGDFCMAPRAREPSDLPFFLQFHHQLSLSHHNTSQAVRSGLEDAVTDGTLDWTDFLAVYRRISRRVQDQLDYAR